MADLGRRFAWLLILGMMPACANATRHGHALYVEGRLIEAAEVFEHSEANLDEFPPKERVRYGLYRGATLLRLGDLDGASRWLYFARQAETHSPGSLESLDAQTLQLAFKALDEAKKRAHPNVDPLKGALARANSGSQPQAPDVVAPSDSAAATATTIAAQPSSNAARPLVR